MGNIKAQLSEGDLVEVDGNLFSVQAERLSVPRLTPVDPVAGPKMPDMIMGSSELECGATGRHVNMTERDVEIFVLRAYIESGPASEISISSRLWMHVNRNFSMGFITYVGKNMWRFSFLSNMCFQLKIGA